MPWARPQSDTSIDHPFPIPIPSFTRQAQLLSRGWPLLLTCFGLHEARLEASLLEALEANFTRHAEGSFGGVAQGDWNGGNAMEASAEKSHGKI